MVAPSPTSPTLPLSFFSSQRLVADARHYCGDPRVIRSDWIKHSYQPCFAPCCTLPAPSTTPSFFIRTTRWGCSSTCTSPSETLSAASAVLSTATGCRSCFRSCRCGSRPPSSHQQGASGSETSLLHPSVFAYGRELGVRFFPVRHITPDNTAALSPRSITAAQSVCSCRCQYAD